MRRSAVFVLLLWLSSVPAWAVQPDEVLADPALEARARALSVQLRCLVCQNQSIDDSAAPLARDLRLLVRERLEAGDSDAQVKTYLVSRYGNFVLLKPPFIPETLLLWVTPLFVLVAGAVAIVAGRRLTRLPAPTSSLEPSEEAKLAALMRDPNAG
ncbi:cytochrome c-type biogenesis protein [Lichenifustis flavocetrariae]|uniref:Cytochrome c-type biogenesis protein n=1 Tax=Lichenifustis flavocetrariae TaxID=2949735 RepID=A0AA42CGS8_9HYPH|nr:cytochrome c-type biogenesis protein CcmH [Lichenifustis flavocetrariae]MCW6506529.1 cytochrome c-type biogenesis protein CcmH [Lichenifustis flavocetrariae]